MVSGHQRMLLLFVSVNPSARYAASRVILAFSFAAPNSEAYTISYRKTLADSDATKTPVCFEH